MHATASMRMVTPTADAVTVVFFVARDGTIVRPTFRQQWPKLVSVAGLVSLLMWFCLVLPSLSLWFPFLRALRFGFHMPESRQGAETRQRKPKRKDMEVRRQTVPETKCGKEENRTPHCPETGKRKNPRCVMCVLFRCSLSVSASVFASCT